MAERVIEDRLTGAEIREILKVEFERMLERSAIGTALTFNGFRYWMLADVYLEVGDGEPELEAHAWAGRRERGASERMETNGEVENLTEARIGAGLEVTLEDVNTGKRRRSKVKREP